MLASMVLLLAADGCGRGAGDLKRLPDDAVILAFGDSLTHGTGAPADQSYPDFLQRLSGYRVIKSGVPGEITAGGLARLPGELERHLPDLVLLCHGGNDLLRRLPEEETAANLSAMVDLIRAAGAQVLLIGVPKPGVLLRAHPLYERVAQSKRIAYEPEAVAEVLSSASLKSDPIHPNERGYRKIAEAVAARFQAR
jgi:lysophospholipase L1-like esterase